MRKVSNYTVTDKNRDEGKVFQITEMPADQQERWGARAVLAVMRSGVDIPEELAASGMAGIAQVGLKALAAAQWEDVEPLLNEMMGCLKIIPDPKVPQVARALIDSDIEELSTRLKLRAEIWKLHVDFSQAASR